MQLLFIGLVGLGLFVIGAVLVFISMQWIRSDTISDRLKEYVAEPASDQRTWRTRVVLAPRELTGSLVARLVMPVIHGLGRFLGRLTPSGAIDDINHRLMIAGNPYNLGAREFYGLSLAMTLFGIGVAVILLRRGLDMLYIAGAILVVTLFTALPHVWLRGRMQRRQNAIRRNLPDALDMLSVCASAGLGFDQSLQRVSEYWDTPLSAEFTRMLSEMEMGLSRREAMRNMVTRTDVNEISSFVALILQADQLGMSISDTLQAIAEQMRIERRFRAQEMAQKAPTKMLFPMAFLIFPALIAIVLGPSVPAFVDLFRDLTNRG